MVDSLYGHLDRRLAKKYQVVKRGQHIGTIGNCYGIYAAHLHLEVRKNLQIGMNRSAYAKDYSNYYSPRAFIAANRNLNSRGETFNIPVDGAYGQESTDNTVASASTTKSLPSRSGAVSSEEAKRRQLEERLKQMAESNKKKSSDTKEEDMDGFWSRLKNRLSSKK